MTRKPPPLHPTPGPRRHGMGTDLWRMIAAPIIWAVHFLFFYVVAAIHCEKAGRTASLSGVTWPIGIATVLALGAIAVSAASLWRVRARSLTDNDFDFEHNSPEERHRFLSHVALMLCVLSGVAILYATLPVLLLSTCR
jgi:hypothetical protein